MKGTITLRQAVEQVEIICHEALKEELRRQWIIKWDRLYLGVPHQTPPGPPDLD